MRAFFVALALAAACGPASTPSSTTPPAGPPTGKVGPRLDLHCTPQPDFDEAACAARSGGCSYQPPLICRGTEPDDGTQERERLAYEAGTEPCQCVCQADILACSQVP